MLCYAELRYSPGVRAVVVECFEVLTADELAAVHARLDCAEAAEHAHLFHRAHHRRDVQSLEFRVDGMQAADKVLQEQVEHLW